MSARVFGVPTPAHNGKWYLRLPVGETQDHEHLTAIPGLSVRKGYDFDELIGNVDAIAAVCTQVGLPPPAQYRASKKRTKLTPKFLRPYQVEGVNTLVHLLETTGGALLCDDMGLGKSVQAVVAARHFPGRKLVVCPASVRETWRGELKKLGETSVAVLTPGNTKADKAEWAAAPSTLWVVVSYELLDRAMKQAFGADVPETVIADEAHLVRGRGARRADAVQEAVAMGGRGILLTGTPLWSRPRDMWRLTKILWGSRFGNQYDFDRRYCAATTGDFGGWENKGSSNEDELRLRLSYYMIRREKRDVAKDLPALTRQVMWLDSTPAARAAYERLQMGLTKAAMYHALVATLKDKSAEAVRLAAEAKKFVLFTWLKAHAESLHKQLVEGGTPCELVTGDIGTKERQARIERAVANGAGVVATIDSVGTGVDALKRVGSVGIVHALDWVPLKMAQAEARLHRIGMSDEPVTIYYLAMQDSADVPVIRTVIDKLDSFVATIGAKETKQMREALSVGPNLTGKDGDDVLLSSLYASMLGRDAPDEYDGSIDDDDE